MKAREENTRSAAKTWRKIVNDYQNPDIRKIGLAAREHADSLYNPVDSDGLFNRDLILAGITIGSNCRRTGGPHLYLPSRLWTLVIL